MNVTFPGKKFKFCFILRNMFHNSIKTMWETDLKQHPPSVLPETANQPIVYSKTEPTSP